MLCFTTISFGQSSIETDKSHLKELILKSFDEIWSELNSKNIDKYYTKDFLLLENSVVFPNSVYIWKSSYKDTQLLISRRLSDML